MVLLCVNNKDNESLLTVNKVYIGNRVTDNPELEDWWRIDKCDDGFGGFFKPEKFIEAPIQDLRVKDINEE